jgi:hypothetical protein
MFVFSRPEVVIVEIKWMNSAEGRALVVNFEEFQESRIQDVFMAVSTRVRVEM